MKSTRQTGRAARGVTALALAAGLALAVSACGGTHAGGTAKSGSTTSGSPTAKAPAPGQQPTGEPLATIKGADGIVLIIDSAKREDGGFVTVSGEVENTGSQPFTGASQWRGGEEALQINGGSLAGATLVDLAAKKRYYVLRDTAGHCLCTTGLDIIQPGVTLPVFAQFPAPPATTTQVDFNVPTLPPASIVISQ